MKCRFMALGLWLCMAFFASAAPALDKLDRLVVGSRTYTNVTVVGMNATDLFFTYDKGMSNAKLKYLEPELQKRFGFDPEAASAAEQQQIDDEAKWLAQMSAKMAADIAAQAEKKIKAAKKAASTYEDSVADPISEDSLLGKAAPDFTVEKWLEEKPVMEGKFLLIDFWAPWSFASRKYIPVLNALQKKFAEKVVVIGITSEPEKELEEMPGPKISFSSAIDTKDRMLMDSGITSIPCLLLVDPKGTVRYQGHPAAIDEKVLQTLIAKFGEEVKK